MVYAVEVLAQGEHVPAPILVDRMLTAYCRRQRDKIPPAPRGVQGPNGDG
ncbi:MAG: hypothetical protein Q8R92_09115 [Deltaproteobacteria bacterium]|nr:hypothetical protein [Deltaproteobacteria bacterium]